MIMKQSKYGRRVGKYDFEQIWKDYYKIIESGSDTVYDDVAKVSECSSTTIFYIIKNDIHNRDDWYLYTSVCKRNSEEYHRIKGKTLIPPEIKGIVDEIVNTLRENKRNELKFKTSGIDEKIESRKKEIERLKKEIVTFEEVRETMMKNKKSEDRERYVEMLKLLKIENIDNFLNREVDSFVLKEHLMIESPVPPSSPTPRLSGIPLEKKADVIMIDGKEYSIKSRKRGNRALKRFRNKIRIFVFKSNCDNKFRILFPQVIIGFSKLVKRKEMKIRYDIKFDSIIRKYHPNANARACIFKAYFEYLSNVYPDIVKKTKVRSKYIVTNELENIRQFVDFVEVGDEE